MTREGLVNLPYSVEEIYGIRESDKYASVKHVYHELYHLYSGRNISQVVPSKIIVEDSNSGYEFFDGLSKNKDYFTELLIKTTEQSYLRYTKRKLNPAYLQKKESQLICKQIEQIEL